MANLQQIRDRVDRKSQDPNSTSRSAATVTEEINRAVRYYSNYRFWFNEALETITLVADQQLIPNIPSDISTELQVNGLLLIDDQVKVDLIKLHPADFFERDDDQTGRPYFYTYRNNEFLLLPKPSKAYPVKLRYLKRYNDLSGDTDTNNFTDNAEDLLMLHALKNIYAEDKEDPERGSAYAELERLEFKALMKRTDSRNGSGYLKSRSILETNYI
jgi:phage regulator Rha-like protein